MYRIPMIHPADPKKLNEKECPSKSIRMTLTKGNKLLIEGRRSTQSELKREGIGMVE